MKTPGWNSDSEDSLGGNRNTPAKDCPASNLSDAHQKGEKLPSRNCPSSEFANYQAADEQSKLQMGANQQPKLRLEEKVRCP